jgi:hypothetical protein
VLEVLTDDATASLLTERRDRGPWGAAGWRRGAPGRNALVRDGEEQDLPAKVTLRLHRGDRLVVETPGGGGYGEAMLAYLGGPAEDYPTEEEIRRFSSSEELRVYLLDNVQVTQGGRTCPGEVEPVEDFLAEGAAFVFTCPEPVEQAHIRVTMLHDRDELYATYSVDGTIQYAVHTSGHPEHLWDFTMAAEERPLVEPALVLGGALVLAALAGTVWFLGRRPGRGHEGT